MDSEQARQILRPKGSHGGESRRKIVETLAINGGEITPKNGDQFLPSMREIFTGSTGVNSIMVALENEGIVKRQMNSSRKRILRIWLTPRGKELADAIQTKLGSEPPPKAHVTRQYRKRVDTNGKVTQALEVLFPQGFGHVDPQLLVSWIDATRELVNESNK